MTNIPSNNPEKNDKDEGNVKNILFEAQEVFVKERLESDKNFFNGKTNRDIFSDFKNFLNSKDKFKETGLVVVGYNRDQKNILVEQIILEKMKFLFVFDKNLENLEKIFEKEYDSSLDLLKLKNEISKLENFTLKKLLKSETKRREFLKSKNIFSNEEDILKSKKIDEENLLENIGISKKELKKLNSDQKDELFSLFNSYRKIGYSDLENILLILDNENSKKNLLKYFLSSVSLENLEKNKILNSSVKDKVVESIKTKFGISEAEAKNIYNSLDKSEVFLSIDDIENLDFGKILNDKSIQKIIIDEYNSDLKEDGLSENILANLSLDRNGKIHNSFLNFVKNSEKISPDLKNQISKFQVGNFLEISLGGKTGYYFIKEIDVGNSLSSKNIVFENVTAEGGIKKVGKGYNESFTYERIFDLLALDGEINSEGQTSKINFYSPEELKNIGVSEKIDGSLDVSSYDDLVKGLDSVDPEGKDFGLDEDKTTFVDEKSGFVFLIDKVNKGKNEIVINQGGHGNKKISFKDFYSIIKSSNGGIKRAKKINNFSDLVLGLSGNVAFSGLEVKDGKIYDKNLDKNHKFPINTFLGGNNKGIIIKKIGENEIEYLIGDVKDEKGKKNLKNSEKSTNFSQFLEDIKRFDFSPKKDSKLEEEKEKGETLKQKSGFFKKLMSGLSISDIISSGNFWLESVKKKLETGNRLKSLRFARKFGGLLGKDMKYYLQSKAEQEEKGLIEEIVSNFQQMDSGQMIEQILEIIENKGSEQYEILGAMMSVIKYGNLYPKGLAKYSGSFMWYKLLGGTESFKRDFEKNFNGDLKPGDKDYRNFTEEELIMMWLKKLGKDGKVRSKFWKDYAKAIGSNTNDEYEAGKDQAGKHTTFPARYNEFEGFLKGREYAGAIGALEKVFAKNGDPRDMNKGPFVFAVSGYGKNLNSTLVGKILEMQYSFPYTTLKYCTSENGSLRYRNFIKTLIKEKFPENKKMLSDFENVISASESEIVGKASSFWDKYGGDIAKYLSFENPDLIFNRNRNSNFKDFYETSKGMLEDNNYSFKDDAINDGVYEKNKVWYFGNGMSKIRSDQAGSFGGPESEYFYKRHLYVLDNIKNYSGSMEEKKEIFKEVFARLEEKVRNSAGIWADRPLEGSPFTNEFYKRGLTLAKMSWGPERYDQFLEENFYNFMNKVEVNIGNTINSTKLTINDLLK